MFIFVAGLTFNMWEYFPQNAMLMFLWGTVLGCGYRSGPMPAMAQPIAADSYYRRPS
jgi:hypothetical protein